MGLLVVMGISIATNCEGIMNQPCEGYGGLRESIAEKM